MNGPQWCHGVTSEREYRVLHQRAVDENVRKAPGRYAGTRVHRHERQAVAYVSYGKWVIDCACGNGPSASPEWQLALCFSCGAVFEDILFPADVLTLDFLLSARREPNRCWKPDETFASLADENEAHGLKVDAAVRKAAHAADEKRKGAMRVVDDSADVDGR